MEFLKRRLDLIVPFAMLLLALGFRVGLPGPVEEAQLKVFDVFQRILPRDYQPVQVKVIDLDDESLERIGQWPWPRTYIAELVARLANAGAAVIAFDIVFAEPDRTSPSQVLPLWPSTPEIEALRRNAEGLPDHDAIFADVVGQAKVVTGFVLTDQRNDRKPAQKGGYAFAGDDPKPFLPAYVGAVTNLPDIEAAAAGNGSISFPPEADGIIRRIPLLLRLGDAIYPSLAAEALRVAQGASTYIVKSSGAQSAVAFGEHTGINHVKIGAYEVPTDANGRIWLHFTRDVPARRIPAWTVFSDDFDQSLVAGNILFVGTSAAGLKDLRASPLNPAMAGVEAHVLATEQILLQYFLERPDWAEGAELVYLVVLGLALILLLPRLGAMWCAVLAVGGTAAVSAASWLAFVQLHWLLDPVFPSVVVLFVYLGGSLVNFLKSEAGRREVRNQFAHYMSPALVDQLAENPDSLKLGGEMKDVTLMFCDVRGFTSISEIYKTDPQGLTRLINRFLTPMTEVILERRGTIDKYMGDCIMAFWNAPLDDADHARHACASALAMMRGIVVLNKDLKSEAEAEDRRYIPIKIGIGVNSDECCVGNMGSQQRFDYSVLGDGVNLASRLEGQSKTYGVGIVIGESTYERVKKYAMLELDLIQVKGKNEAVHIYTLLGEANVGDSPEFKELNARHGAMLAAYRGQRWQEARGLVSECRKLNGDLSDLYDLYDDRLDAYESDPPGADWDGVFIATTK